MPSPDLETIQTMASIRLEQVSKRYPNGVRAVDDASLEIRDGEFLVLVGPSGCGKSTTLRMIAGLEEVTTGTIYIGDRLVNHVAAGQRDMAMVFQNYALYPHMTVRQNLSFGLRVRRLPRAEIRRRVNDAANLLGISPLLDRRPAELSGGQRQRVALGRALVRQPAAFLLDEPLSNLDARLRAEMRTELARLHQDLHTTTVYVTHDQVEAMTLGERIVVMHESRIQQVSTPLNIYHYPANRFVAEFIGSPPMNFVEGNVQDGKFISGNIGYAVSPAASRGRRLLGFRPESLSLDASQPPLGEMIVDVIERMGHETLVYGNLDGHSIVARFGGDVTASVGRPLMLHLPASDWHVFSLDADQPRIAGGRTAAE